MRHITLALLVLVLAFAACEGPITKLEEQKERERQAQNPAPKKKYNGERVTHYNDGSIKSRVNIVEGRMHGKAYNYYKNGRVHSEFEYDNGAHSGPTKWYYESGKLYQVIPYQNGVKHGLFVQYYETGKVQAELPYFEGYEGLGLKEYTNDGKLKTQYPKLQIKELGFTAAGDTVGLELSLSGSSSAVKYFYGELTDGKYLNDLMEPVHPQDGKAVLPLPLSKGTAKQQYDIVAQITTAGGFAYLMHKRYTVPAKR